jgi:hypothetical protein
MHYQNKNHHYEEKRFTINKKDHDKCKDHHWGDHENHGKEDDHDKRHDHKDCVEEVLAAILTAQKKVENDHKKSCGCKDSIKDLLEEPKKPRKNTIPFILYCGCEPFEATGVTTYPGGPKDKKLACITSYIFRISDLNDQCAELELLAFKPKKNEHRKICSPCDQIDCEHIDDLVRTGICITVDLSCFCAVTCLPAVRL